MPMSTPPEPAAAPSPVPAPPATRGTRLLLAGAAVALLGLLVGPRLSASRRDGVSPDRRRSARRPVPGGQAPARGQRDFRRGRLAAALSGPSCWRARRARCTCRSISPPRPADERRSARRWIWRW